MSDSNTVHKLFVGNVPYVCEQEDFLSCFSSRPGFVSAEVVLRPNGSTKGFGFVILDSDENTQNLLQQEIYLGDRLLRLENYTADRQVTSRRPSSYKVFLRNVPSTTTTEEIEEHFSTYGNVVSSNLNVREGQEDEYVTAVVEFEDRDGLQKALVDKETTFLDTTLRIYPFQRRTRRVLRGNSRFFNNQQQGNQGNQYNTQDRSAVYRSGFKAGRAVGYEEGRKEGRREALESVQSRR